MTKEHDRRGTGTGEALEEVTQRSWGHPTPANVQGQAGWGSKEHDLVKESLKLDDL